MRKTVGPQFEVSLSNWGFLRQAPQPSELTMEDVRFSSERRHFCDEDAARAVYFIEHFCSHVRGSFAGQSFTLAAWQKSLIREMFGRKSSDGTRQYKHVWIEAPVKSGKTTLAAAIALYMLLVDREQGAESYIAAPTLSAAKMSFNIIKRMIENCDDMSIVCTTKAETISYKDNYLSILSGSGSRATGIDASFIMIDNIQDGFSDAIYETLVSSMASRKQPLILYLASATDRKCLAWNLHNYAISVVGGDVVDPSWLVCIFSADADDDWTDPRVWQKVHPGLGQSISSSFLREQCLRALHNPGYASAFKRLYLNVWTDNEAGWLNLATWDKCQVRVDTGALSGRSCKIGLDLSSCTDLTAVVAVFPDLDGGYSTVCFPFCPEENIKKRSRVDGVDYEAWRDGGFITATEGNIVDYRTVRDKIMQLCQMFDVEEVAFDRWGASMLISDLVAAGVRCTPVNQDALSMARPAQELERALQEGVFRHDGNPVLRWCATNVKMVEDGCGGFKPSKRRSKDRIDLVIALLIALSRFPRITASSDAECFFGSTTG